MIPALSSYGEMKFISKNKRYFYRPSKMLRTATLRDY